MTTSFINDSNSLAEVGCDWTTLIELLRSRALQHPEKLAYTYLRDGETEEASLTYGELDRRARKLAASLQAAGATGQRVLLLYPPDLEYVSAFFACLYAGAVAVPAYPPRQNRNLDRLQAIIIDAQARFALTTSQIRSRMEPVLKQSGLKGFRLLDTAELEQGSGNDWFEPAISAGSLAFLQYTSGSTSTPKGVMVTHGNLLHNQRMIQQAFRQTQDSLIAGWLPLYHDMGLIGNVLQPLYVGASAVLMSPVAFLQSPFRWLEVISRYKATTSGGPNFAYDLCVRKITAEQRAQLDLSSWDVAFNGAEPVRAETMDRFSKAFAPHGFTRDAFFPCYGLAEGTLFVSGKSGPVAARSFDTEALANHLALEVEEEQTANYKLVGCGGPYLEQKILIVNAETLNECLPGAVGEIWISGASVAKGYWNQPETTEQTFQAYVADTGEGPFLRSGDLGFLYDGELFITGRLKDLIIINGLNRYPQDIERTVEQSHSSCRQGCGAAFSIEVEGAERLVVVQELERGQWQNTEEVFTAIRQRVAEEHELQLHAICLLKPGGVPKTSSGKIQRRACREAFINSTLEPVARWVENSVSDTLTIPGASDEDSLQSWLQAQLAATLSISASRIDIAQPILGYGLDSLSGIELIHKIETGLGVTLPVASILENPSINDLAEMIRTAGTPGASSLERKVIPTSGVATHPLSINQQSLWFMYQMAPESAVYNLSFAASLNHKVDVSALKRAFESLVKRHASLRTTFIEVNGAPVQKIHPEIETCFDVREAEDSTFDEQLAQEAQRPFDLQYGPLLRLVLFTRNGEQPVLLMVAHHIIVDFWSLAVLMHELSDLYTAANSDLAPVNAQYTDYARWQHDMLEGDAGQRLWSYWEEQLSGTLPILNLPTDRPRPPVQTYNGSTHRFSLTAELLDQIKLLGQRSGATLYMTLLAAYEVLLSRYTGQDEILVGTPTAGRGRGELSDVVGYFVNPVVLRARLSSQQSFASLLARTRQNVIAAFAHQDYPFALLVQRLQPEREASRTPVFQTMFVLQKSHLLNEALATFALGGSGAPVELGALTFEPIPVAQRAAQFDLMLMMAEVNGQLEGSFEYNTDLFEASTIERLASHFERLLAALVAQPEASIWQLEILGTEEREQQLQAWNDTRAEYAKDVCIHQLFEAQVERTPEAVAVVFGAEQVSYRELNERANQLADYLRGLGVGREVRVGVLLERSAEMVGALLGIMKAGGAYVPLDPTYPQERLSFMAMDAELAVLLTQESLRELVALPASTRLVCVEDSSIAGCSNHNPGIAVNAANLAYLIYTSGSTGTPKGVAIQHHSTATLIHWAKDHFSHSALSSVLASTSLCFDLSVFELFVPLSVGGQVILAENALALPQLAAREQVRLINTVPSAMAELVRQQALPASIEVINLAGEALGRALVESIYEQLPDSAVYNLYGPSEDTTYSTAALIARGDDAPSIGRPVSNTQAYVLDRELQLMPAGVSGELYLSGDGVARGYLNRPELTADRFVPNPYSAEPGARMYRTGDLVRYRRTGKLEYLGRGDQQVKVRGYRVELGEIEARLAEHEQVREAVVVVREEDGDKRLVAYLVAQSDELQVSELRAFLKESLPGYMIPSAFVILPELPLTANGKVNRRALPAPEWTQEVAESAGARTPVEAGLLDIWAAVLKISEIGIHDNFFDLGGHSLLATQLVSRVRQTFAVELALHSLFERPTVASLSELIEEALRAEQGLAMSPIRVVERDETTQIPLSFAQQRLWFLDQLEPGSAQYNMPAAVRLTGDLNIRALEQSLTEVIRRHEALRTVFAVKDGDPVQLIKAASSFELPLVDLSAETEHESERLAAAEARRPFDLTTGPLLRAQLLKLNSQEHIILLTMHHIVSDGWSLGVLVSEVAALYQAYLDGRPSPLPELTIQYADFAYWQREWLQGEVLEKQLDYWKKQLDEAPALLELPTDRPRPASQSFVGANVSLELSKSLTESLKALSQQEGTTLFMTLLAAFQILLSRYSGKQDIVVGTPIANRNHAETENLIGFFVNTLVLRTDLSGKPTCSELLRRVREVCLGAYAHQDVPFEKLVEALQVERSLSHTPLFQVLFALQNAPFEALQLPQLTLDPLDTQSATAKFDLSLSLQESDGALHTLWNYNTDLFEASTIERLAWHFERLLAALVGEPEASIWQLEILGAEEREQQLQAWNDTRAEYAKDVCIHQLFEAQVERTPEAVAVVFGAEQVSYCELNERANQLADYLRGLGVGGEVRVGVLLERSAEMVVALLGIMKAGGAYVPLDSTYPQERLSFMATDAELAVLLTQESLRELVALPASTRLVCVEDSSIAGCSNHNPGIAVNAGNLAYLIYTSGSTGTPKGVAIQHHSTTTLIHWAKDHFSHSALSSVLASTSLCFDLSVFELFVPLSVGGQVILAENALALPQLAAREQVRLINTVPSAMAELVRQQALPASIEVINLAGEALGRALVESIYEQLPDSAVYNLYGPSEDTTYSTAALIARGDDAPSIGRPVSNTQAYVLDRELQLAPAGVSGELYLSGDGVARGYMNRPELTADRFVPNPFSSEPGARMYRTGDLVRYRRTGTLEYLERGDQQVKVRGYRVELGEIEARLAEHEQVREAVVVVREEDGDKRLVAYLVAQSDELQVGELRAFLKESLPGYMIPSAFVILPELPLTANGKVNRRALPVQEWKQEVAESAGARTPVEAGLLDIWAAVLKVSEIGIHDNFFELGGHSLLATRLISHVRQSFQVELPLRTLFESPTVAQFAEQVQRAAGTGLEAPPIVARQKIDLLPLSFAQQRLWFLDQLEPDSAFYNIPMGVRLEGELNVDALESALTEITKRHEALRTTFKLVDGEPRQVISAPSKFTCELTDLHILPGSQREAEAKRIAKAEAAKGFDLATGPLIRVRLLSLNEQEYILLLTMHHIVSDGWSIGVFVREFAALYEAFVNESESRLPELPIQYGDFSIWQREWLTDEAIESQLTYWQEQLTGAPTVLELPTDRPRPVVQSFSGASYTLAIDRELTQSLKALSSGEGTTLFMTLLAAFQILLSRYTGQRDILVGTPIANRTRSELEDLIGLFMNTLVIRTRLSLGDSFHDLLARLRNVTLGAYAHQDVPFEKLVEALQVERSLSHTPLFQVLFALQNAPFEALQLPQLTLNPLDTQDATAKFDLSLSLQESDSALHALWNYNTDLFEASTIRRLASHFERLLEALVVQPEASIWQLEILGAEEREQQLQAWNDTRADYAEDISIHQLFEAQVERTPEPVAVGFDTEKVTYRELNERANQLAHYLRGLGVGREVRVGVLLERSAEMVVALLGIMKAGGVYVPLDPTYPQERLKFMATDAELAVLLTQESLRELVELPESTRLVCVEEPSIASCSKQNPETQVSTANLAYLIYTSGSTGTPKGVQITHQNVVNFLQSMSHAPGLTEHDTLLSVTTLSFDIAGLELFLPLTVGAQVVVASREVAADGEQLSTMLANTGATVMQATPATWRLLLETGWQGDQSLKMLCGGEALSGELAGRMLERGATLWNLYGPTETTIWSSAAQVMSGEGTPSIGRPIANTQAYVLDRELQLVPAGVSGELYLSGDGVARGYLNRPALTADRFVPNPFGQEPGARMYRTGDLVRYRSGGELEYLGRGDQQVKVRGYRVELGEIEGKLSEHEQVREAVVVVREEDGDKRLVAYLVAQSAELQVSELRRYLKERLPAYMVPSQFVTLAELPLTANGKVNRRALPAPEWTHTEVTEKAGARTPVEAGLLDIWAAVLKVSEIGIHDNFFDLGGHSLLATQLVSRVRQTFAVELALRSLFERPTVAGLGELVEEALRAEQGLAMSPIRIVERDEMTAIPLSFAQQRLWFLDQLEPGSAQYNIPAAVRLTGDLNTQALEQSLTEVIRRHETLRTSFSVVDEQPVQVISPFSSLVLATDDLRRLEENEREPEVERLVREEAKRPFDLKQGPLMRARLVRLSEQQHVLLFTMHHIITDGWSLGVLIREVAALYEAYVSDNSPALAELPIQYADFTIWQREWLNSGVLDQQLAYWKKQLSGAPAVLEFPTDRPRPATQSSRGAKRLLKLQKPLVAQLKDLSRREDATLFMTLLAAFQTLLYRYTGQQDISVGTPIANRSHWETEALIGFFTNTLVMRNDLSGNPTFTEFLQRVKEVALGAYAHQEVPFEKLVEELQVKRSLSYTPLFQVMFGLQSDPRTSLQLPSLTLDLMDTPGETTHFDLSLSFTETSDEIRGELEYNTDLFDATTIERITDHFFTLLHAIVVDPARKLSSLPMLSVAERYQLKYGWNSTAFEFAQDRFTHQLFEVQAAFTPNKIALTFEDRDVNYGELNDRANQLAHLLIAKGVAAETCVGVCVERSVEMVVALLAIFKAGGAYLPLDSQHPQDRLSFMLADAKPQVVITQQQFSERFAEFPPDIICFDTDAHLITSISSENPAVEIQPADLAYIIYTSGSTGRPKGVQVEHRHLLGTLLSARLAYGFTSADVVPCVATYCFDIYLFELLSPLLVGGRSLIMNGREVLEPRVAKETLQQVTFIHATPGLMRQFVQVVKDVAEPERYDHIRQVMVGGDAVSPELLPEIQSAFINAEVSVGYGPTETTIMCGSYSVERGHKGSHKMLGSPMANCRMIVCDREGELVPIGVVGEVLIGGDGVARGYLNQEQLTAEKYVIVDGERYYRSGDLGRRLEDGSIAFAGRVDEQVKVRGFRVELGEVESALNAHAGIKECVVVAWEDEGGEKRLVAYAVAEAGPALNLTELRSHLGQRLPEYMVPSAIVVLEELPLTAHGKIDKRALPDPELTRLRVEREYVAPRTPVESLLARIWSSLLNVERIGVHDDFFEFGGHSLLATQLVSRVRDALQVEIPVRRLFEGPTIARFAEQVDTALRAGDELLAPPIITVSKDAPLPLSFAQQRLWFIDQLEPNSFKYNMPHALRLSGPLKVEVMEATLSEIVRRHEVLRTSFVVVDGEPVQVINPPQLLKIQIIDISDKPQEEHETELLRLASAEVRRVFDLKHDLLLRMTLVRLGDEEHVALFTTHHIASDGWSITVLVKEVVALYGAFVAGLPSPLPELSIQYADFAVWQREWLQGEVLDKQLSYWKQQLEGSPAVLELPTDRPRLAIQKHPGANQQVVVPNALADSLKELSRREGVTLFMTLLAAFETLLMRYSGQEDINVGMPIANRNRGETEALIGFFANTLVMRGNLSGDPTFTELLQRVKEVALGAYAHQDVPFEKLVEEMHVERSLSHSPLFQVMFVLENVGMKVPELPGLHVQPLAKRTERAIFDMSLGMIETDEGIVGELEYNTDLFNASTIERFTNHFLTLLNSIVIDPIQKLSELTILTPAERRVLVHDWNRTDIEFPQELLTHQIIAAQAALTPGAIALRFEDQQLRYDELNRRVNQLANLLIIKGVGAEVPVGLSVSRSLDMVISLLAIFKAGGAYLPLEPEYPQERLRFIVEDAKPRVVLTHEEFAERFDEFSTEAICLDSERGLIGAFSDENPAVEVGEADLAYIIYTSGSTGTPKGVQVEHRHLLHTMTAARHTYGFTAADVVPVVAPFSFDIYLFEVLSPLLVGGTSLLLKSHAVLDSVIAEAALEQVTFLHSSTGVMRQLVNVVKASAGGPANFQHIRHVFVGGDAVSPELVREMEKAFTNATVSVGYGPTEATIMCASYPVQRAQDVEHQMLGYPLANCKMLVCDSSGEVAPIGVVGEVWIGGAGVARGYLNQPELTAEKFVVNGGERYYRSGDLGRWLEDGSIAFAGRADEQVKVRGFRVELGEVEAVLAVHGALAEAVVVARPAEGGERQLVAYVVPKPGQEVTTSELRRYLRDRLPDYLVPSAIVTLEAMPLTPLAKIDRRALPAPELTRSSVDETFNAPRTPVEEGLTRIWCEVLKLDRVGIHENFFALGGHSLLATQLISRIREVFQVEVPLQTLFEKTTVAELGESVEEALRSASAIAPVIEPVSHDGELLLSFAQQRLWFLDQFEPGSASYNIPAAVRLAGTLDQEVLEDTLTEIVRRHESLRTTFVTVAGEPRAVVAAPERVVLSFTDLSGLEEVERQAEAMRLAKNEAQLPFDLTAGPLLRASLLKSGVEDHVVLLTMHHIISDGWSMDVFIREFSVLYSAFLRGEKSPLDELPIQYADFAHWQQSWLTGDVLEQQLSYWHEQLRDAPPVLELPTDHARPPVQSFRGATHSMLLSDELTAAVKSLSREQGTTLFMTLLAAFQTLLWRYTGQAGISVGTPIANRNRGEIEQLIGFFINTLVLYTELSDNPSFADLIKRVRNVCLRAYAHQDVPFEKLVDELQPERSLSHAPLFQVMFALQNAPLSELKLPNLSLSPLEWEYATAKFDLSLTLEETNGSLRAAWEYSTDLFDAATIERMASHFETLLAGAIAEPKQRLSDLPLLSPAEAEKLLVEWNDTAKEIPSDRCIQEFFEAQVARTPNSIAVVCDDEQLTYAELNARANQLAHYLVELGVRNETRVGLCVERSVQVVIGLLGIFKAGGVYVPLDPQYPQERLAYMLQDSRVALLVTESQLPQHSVRTVCLDADAAVIASQSESQPRRTATAESLAYLIYTSGSSGKPKAVMVQHHNLVNTVLSSCEKFALTEADVMPCLAAFSFDIALLELLMPLVTGAQLQIITRQHVLDVERLVASVAGLTIIHTVPSLMRQIVEFIKRADVTERSRYEKLRLILIGGDAVSPELLREIQEVFPSSHIEVLYGPTEATIICITYGVPGSECQLERQTIGKPLPNVKISIRDRQQGIVPIGVAGEVYIAGRGVTLGYLHQPELTAEKYVTIDGERWYRSGDRGRFLADGNVEFMGRIDEQVKIKGFRIELGEIEARLNEHEGVREAVVVVREENGDKRLVAYLVASSETAPTVSELRSYLGEMLPEYMIPSNFVTLAEIPLTANGKVNRRALPAPDSARPDLALAFVAPASKVEQTLAAIWSQVLKLESVGIHDNFFELGGDSILSIQIVARAQQAGLRLTPKQLFQHQTIAELAEAVGTSSVVRANQGVVTGAVGLTPIQQWFLSHEVYEVNHYNQALLLEVMQGADLALLEHAVREVVVHHDALRMRFERGEDGEWTQSNAGLEAAKDVWSIRDLSAVAVDRQREAIETEAEQVQRSLNLQTGPLVQAVYMKLGDYAPGRLLLVVHHLVMDGVSWRVFLEDLSTAYEQLASGAETVKLPAKTTSYQEWVERLQEYAASEEVAKEFDYWNREINRAVAALPIDTEIVGDNTVASARKISVSLSVDETRLLLTQATKKYRARINEVLLSAVMQGYTQWTGQTSLKLDVEGHGREQEFVGEVDLTRTVGWFTSVYPVVLEVAGGADVVTVLKSAKEDLRRIPREGLGYGVLRFMSPDPSVRAALAGAGKADVTFNYLGQFDGVLNEDGLLRAAAEFAGPSVDKNTKRHYAVEIYGSISEGRLHLVWSYSEALHRRESIETFADNSIAALRELISLSAIDTTSGLTPSDFPLAQVSSKVLEEMAAKDALIEDIYPLSATQHGMLLHSLSAPDSEAYYDQTSCTITGPLNVSAFELAWQRVVNRHSVLRTAFIWQGLDEPLQVVHRTVDLHLAQHDWRSLSGAAQQKQLEALLEEDRKRGFRLEQPPLMRLTLVRTADEEYEFAWSWHHLLMDGWSLSIVFQQVFELYRSLSSGSETAPARSRSYREYISWLQQQDLSQSEDFWRQTLKGFTTPTAIGLKPVSSNGNSNGSFDNQNIQLAEETTAVLQALARRRQLTLNTFIQGAWAILLGHYSKTHDVVFGVTVSGRPAALPGVEEIVGLFINTLPLRIKLSPELAILDWLQQVQQQLVDLRQYEYAPLVDVQRWSDVSHGVPLFESIVAFDNYPFDHDMLERAADVKIGNVHIVNWNNFPLSLVATPGATLNVEVKYERHRFAADDAAWMAQQFESLLRTIAEQPQAKLLTLTEKLAEADQQRQLNREANYQDNLRRSLRRTR
jgi:amino acid adenylation domain-containing protein/non-ribosomal peptide synthase protein (TIGR01720 family)